MSEVRKKRVVRRRKPKIKFDKQKYRNLKWAYRVIIGFLFIMCIVIVRINITEGDNYSIKVLQQQSFTSRVVPFKRGDIKDRNGNVLATSVMMYNLVIDCKLLKADGNERYMEPTVNALVKYFGFDREDLITSINERKNSSYWVAKKELRYEDIKDYQAYEKGEFVKTDEEEKAVNNTKGIWFEEEYKRQYLMYI